MISAKDRREFAAFCAAATDAQLQGIYDKESAARRPLYAEIAQSEARGRGFELER
jgi:hypothetical protein